MPRLALLCALPFLFFFSCPSCPADTSATSISIHLLELDPPPSEPPEEIPLSETPSFVPHNPQGWIVYGRFQPPHLSVGSLDRIGATDGLGRPLPLVIETNTLTREFGEIVGLTFALELPPESLDAGPLRIEWGNALQRSNPTVARLSFSPVSAQKVRRFSLTRSEPSGEETRLGTISIIADSRADYYFWWYLLPMAVVFALLAINKIWTR